MSLPYQQALSDLQAQLSKAVADCERYAIPAHAVRNCPSDLQNHDFAWRRRQSLEYQIAQLEKAVDKTETSYK